MGRWDLTAIGVNQVIGGGIFLVPGPIAAALGSWSPIGFVAAGLAMLLIGLCYAEAASRFSVTGGAYVYTRAAFGNLVGFEIGWMQWFVRVSSQAAVVSGIATAIGYYLPGVDLGWGRVLFVSGVTLAVGYLHTKGIRQSALAVNIFTFGKLAPLLVFIAVGSFLVEGWSPGPLPSVSREQAISAGLLLVFTFGGFDTVSVIAGEAKRPQRDIPFGLAAAIICVTLIMTAAQTVYVASSPADFTSATPLADSAQALMGWAGAALIGAGSVVSMLGNNVGGSLSASRMLYAFAEQGDIPTAFGQLHARYRTPVVAIWFSTAVAVLLAVTGSFTVLAGVSAVARLVTYVGVSFATLKLRRRHSSTATFVLPFGPTIPLVAATLSAAMVAGATRQQLLAGALALAGGAVLYWVSARMGRVRAV